MRGRPKAQWVLTESEREQLAALTLRRKTAQALALRARIVLACADEVANKDVAARQRVTQQTVSKWRARFVEQRLDGLLDAPRPGAPRSIDAARVDAVVAKTLESVPEGATHWSTRTMAREMDLSQTAVSRIWRAFGLQPHRQETFKLSSDPLFVEKVRDIVGQHGHDGYTPCSRHHAPLPTSSIAAVVITASSRAAAVQARPNPHLTRNDFHRCALGRQQPGHRSVFECLSVSSHFCPSSPALSHGINANVVHKWRRLANGPSADLQVPTFVPVTLRQPSWAGGQTSRMCRSKAKPTRHWVPSPGSMVAVRLLMRTMVPATVCRYFSSKAE